MLFRFELDNDSMSKLNFIFVIIRVILYLK